MKAGPAAAAGASRFVIDAVTHRRAVNSASGSAAEGVLTSSYAGGGWASAEILEGYFSVRLQAARAGGGSRVAARFTVRIIGATSTAFTPSRLAMRSVRYR